MANIVRNIVLDGVTDFDAGQVHSWSGGYLDFVGISNFPGDGNTYRYNFTMQGEWQIRHLRLGEFGISSTFTDSNDGMARRIEWLRLGDGGSEVTLGDTRARYINAFDQESNKITLGTQRTTAVELYDGNDTVIGGSGRTTSIDLGGGNNRFTAGTGDVGSLIMGDGNDTLTMGDGAHTGLVHLGGGTDRLTMTGTAHVDTLRDRAGATTLRMSGDTRVESLKLQGGNKTLDLSGDATLEQAILLRADATISLAGNARVFSMKLDSGSFKLTSAAGHLESLYGYDALVDLKIGAGGVSQIALGGETGGVQRISVNGWLGSLLSTGPDRVVLVLKDNAESVRTGMGADRITTGDGFAGMIRTAAGDDLVTLGKGGAGMIALGDGNDTLASAGLAADSSVRVSGGNGTDTLDLSKVGVALDVSLSQGGGYRPIVPEGKASRGWFWIDGFENLIGGAKNDRLEGNVEGNVLTGGAGKDTLSGLDGDDTLVGGKGADLLIGGWGADVFRFAKGDGNDTIAGFEIGMDRLQFAQAARLADVKFAARSDGVLVSVGNVSVLVEDVLLGDLRDADNFIF